MKRLIEIDRDRRCCLEGEGACQGVLQLHHLVKQQHIKDRFKFGGVWVRGKLEPLGRGAMVPAQVTLDELLGDRANLVSICDTHHQAVSNARIYLVPDRRAQAFAERVGLKGVLERQLDRAA